MHHLRLAALAIFAASVCSMISSNSRANDMGEDQDCALECSLGKPGASHWGTPDASSCYDLCVESKKGQGCGHAPVTSRGAP